MYQPLVCENEAIETNKMKKYFFLAALSFLIIACNHQPAEQLLDKDIIAKKEFKIVVDGINSTGSIIVPMLLKQLGVKEVVVLNETPNGKFAHNPEPLPEH